jgi:hypothetical protein
LTLLRNLGPDIVIATHSTEIISEAESDDIVLIDKKHRKARRVKDMSKLHEIFSLLGSNLNPILTQLAKTKRAIFVEGKDFQILSRFAQKLGFSKVSSREAFAVIPIEGFNPQRIRHLKEGMETTLGGPIAVAVILDRDFRCNEERQAVAAACKKYASLVAIHTRKEIENFLLVPVAMDRAASRRVVDRGKRAGVASSKYCCNAMTLLDQFAEEKKNYVMAQYLAEHRQFERVHSPNMHEAQANELALAEFSASWQSFDLRVSVIPGKEALCFYNRSLQEKHSVSVTPAAIVDAMHPDEVPHEMKDLIKSIHEFALLPIADPNVK